MKFRAGSKKYCQACAIYAYNILLDIYTRNGIKKKEHIAMLDVLDALYDIIYDYSEMKDTLEDIEKFDEFFKKE